jgi:hypothetical protein
MNVAGISLHFCVTSESKPGGERLINWEPLLIFAVLNQPEYFPLQDCMEPKNNMLPFISCTDSSLM